MFFSFSDRRLSFFLFAAAAIVTVGAAIVEGISRSAGLEAIRRLHLPGRAVLLGVVSINPFLDQRQQRLTIDCVDQLSATLYCWSFFASRWSEPLAQHSAGVDGPKTGVGAVRIGKDRTTAAVLTGGASESIPMTF